jgi:hypothetical protein
MKHVKLMLLAMLFAFSTSHAQVEVKTTTTTLPDWGVAGSDNARYYYLPDIETYYDIRGKQFVYMNDGKWAKSAELPVTYKDYDLYDGYKVVMTDETEPYPQYDKMKIKYAKGYKGDPQKTVKIKKRADGTVKIKEK